MQNISHEIRTPLNAVCGYSNLLGDEKISENERREYTEIIIESSNRLLPAVVNDILTISTIETGQNRLHKETFDANRLLDEIKEEFSVDTYSLRIDLRVNKVEPADEFLIFSDKEKIRQILFNLVNNALKFTKKGYVEFGCKPRREKEFQEVLFFVIDTVIGIRPEMQNRIFERFRKDEAGKQKLYDGTGPGLSISKGFAELPGGEIWVESVPGEGAGFYFTVACRENETDE